ncbi:MAG: Mov34/MPN/PAD-1 family protein [Candidatus Aenigmarchaeota archaeon]|nr:Mov34/MPN/PAD-1 family protein [Candidatus Aenigmarchaeota archaeon]
MKEKCIFTPEAIGTILVDSYRDRDNETGGILIGPKGHSNIITEVIPSTEYADRTSVSYFQTDKDIAYLNHELRERQKDGYDYIGMFHSHPSRIKTFSNGDLETYYGMLTSPNYAINNHLISCIVTEADDDFPVFAYIVRLVNNKVDVRRADIEIMPMQCIRHFIEITNQSKEIENETSINNGQDSERTEELRDESLRHHGQRSRPDNVCQTRSVPEESRDLSAEAQTNIRPTGIDDRKRKNSWFRRWR